jgi:hypothetical protein
VAVTITGWHCDADIISSVSALSLGEHHAQVHVDLNTDGKRASIVGLASMEGCVDIHMTYRPVVNDQRTEDEHDAMLRLFADGDLQIWGTSEGRYTLFLYIVDDAGRQDIGAEVPRAEDGRTP